MRRWSSLCLPVSADCGFADACSEVVVSGVLCECVGDVLVCVRPLTADVCAQPHACGGGVFGVAVVHVRENGVGLVGVHGRGEGGETHSASSSMGAYVVRAMVTWWPSCMNASAMMLRRLHASAAWGAGIDGMSKRLNSSHVLFSYGVCYLHLHDQI